MTPHRPCRPATLMTIAALGLAGGPLRAATLYVDPGLTGPCTDYDPTSRSCGAGTDRAYADLGAAVDAAVAGDEVLLRAGDHPGPLVPTVSGTAGAPIRIAAFPGEAPVLTGSASPALIQLTNVSYLILEGLTVEDARWVEATGVHHVTLAGNIFLRTPASGTTGNVRFIQSDHNRILDNRLEQGNDNLLLIDSHHNLVQGNTLAEGGHSLLSVRCSTYNVFRSNRFANTVQKIGEVYDCGADTTAVPNAFDATSRNLFEHNTFAAAVTYYSTSGGNGIQYAGQDGIIRRNVFYQTNVGLGMQVYSDEAEYNHENRVYHNVFHDNHCAGVSVSGNGVDNVFVNNVLAGNHGVSGDCFGEGTAQLLYRNPIGEILFRGNAFWAGAAGAAVIQDEFDTGDTLAAFESSYPALFQANLEADPAFTNAAGRDYTLTSGSTLVDAGLFLTRASAAGSGTTLTVEDARFFYDGFGIEGETGDLLQLEGDTATATVLAADLATNQLTLSSSLTWTAGQGVGLAYQGSAPDVGAFELGATTCGDDACDLGESCQTCPADCGPCPLPDGGVEPDSGIGPDGGLLPDGGSLPDGGTDPTPGGKGCGCAADPGGSPSAPTLALLLIGLGILFARRRRSRFSWCAGPFCLACLVLACGSTDTGGAADGSGSTDSGDPADAGGGSDATVPTDAGDTTDAGGQGDGGMDSSVCELPTPDSASIFDFVGGTYTAVELNGSTHFIRSVFSLDIPSEMERIGSGLRLVFDAAALPANVYLDYSYRSELRETDNTTYPPLDTTQVYRLQFTVEEDLNPRYGPGTILQRFNRDNNGPDCEVELTGVDQFSSDDDTPYVQTVCFGERVRHEGVYLQPLNELLVAVYNSATEGEFGVWLNGAKLDGRAGIDTSPSTSGTWLQFGLYEHGLIYDNTAPRAAQATSGSPLASYVYHRFEKRHYAGKLDLGTVVTYDPNALGYQCN